MTERAALLATILGLIALFAVAHPVLDPDMWWHLAVGETILSNRSVHFVDPLSFTNPKIWVNSQWLSEALFAKVQQLVGIRGLEFLALLLKVAVFSLVFASMRAKPLTKVWVTILFAFGAFPLMGGVRPQLLSLLLIALLALAIHKQRHSVTGSGEIRKASFCGLPAFVSLPIIFALWANIHSFYPLAFALLAIAIFADWLNERMGLKPVIGSVWRKQMSISLLLCIFAVMLTPFGWNSAKQVVVNIVQSSQLPIEEWKPATQMRHPLVIVWVFLLLLWLLCIAWSPKRPDALELIWGAFATLNAITGVRMIALWCILVAPFVGEHISEWLGKSEKFKRQSEAPTWLPTLTIALIGFLSGLILAVRFSPDEFVKHERKEYPHDAVTWAVKRGLIGNCLTRYDWGGYVAWKTRGRLKVFVDGRADFYPLKVMRDFISAYYGKRDWHRVLNRYGVTVVIVPKDAPIASLLALRSSEWRSVYRDEVAVIFIRRALAVSPQSRQVKPQTATLRTESKLLQISAAK